MRTGTLTLVLLSALIAAPATAQPNEDSDEDTYDEAAPGEQVDNVDVFYDRLADNGTWVDEPDIGHVFIPETPNYVPYHDGHWSRTSLGFVWVSNEPHAWATTHYGRWAFSRPYSRWVWLPDTTWGPSWVDWRESGDHFGWAPMAPEIVIRTGYVTPVEYWHYAPGPRILDVNITRYYAPRERIVVFHRSAAPIEHYARVSGARVVVGPPAVRLHAYGLRGAAYRPVRIDTRLAGRMTAVEYRGAVQRAHERHDMVEQRNRQRIEANPRIREVHMKAAATVRTQPMHTEPHHMEAHPDHAAPRPEPKYNPAHPEPRHIEPPPSHQPPMTHTAPAHPEPPMHQQPPMTHTAPAHPEPPMHQQPPMTHTAPARPEPPMHQQQPPMTHTAPAHQAPPMTHTAPAATTHTAPTPARPAPRTDSKPAPKKPTK